MKTWSKQKVYKFNIFGELEIWLSIRDYIDGNFPDKVIRDKEEIDIFLKNNS